MNTPAATSVRHPWNYCNVLRDKRHLSVMAEVEFAVEAGLARAASGARLRQVMLKSAFGGRLQLIRK